MTHLESPFRIDAWEPAEIDPLADPDGAGPATDQDTLTGDRGAAHQAHSVFI